MNTATFNEGVWDDTLVIFNRKPQGESSRHELHATSRAEIRSFASAATEGTHGQPTQASNLIRKVVRNLCYLGKPAFLNWPESDTSLWVRVKNGSKRETTPTSTIARNFSLTKSDPATPFESFSIFTPLAHALRMLLDVATALSCAQSAIISCGFDACSRVQWPGCSPRLAAARLFWPTAPSCSSPNLPRLVLRRSMKLLCGILPSSVDAIAVMPRRFHGQNVQHTFLARKFLSLLTEHVPSEASSGCTIVFRRRMFVHVATSPNIGRPRGSCGCHLSAH